MHQDSIPYNLVPFGAVVSEIQLLGVGPSFQFLLVYIVKCLKMGIFEAAKHLLSIAGRAKARVQMKQFLHVDYEYVNSFMIKFDLLTERHPIFSEKALYNVQK